MLGQDKILGEQVDIIDVTDDIANDPTSIGNIATGLSSDPGATATLDSNYLRRDGTVTMDGTLTLSGANNIVMGTGTIAGRNIATDGTTQDDHIADSTLHFLQSTINHANIDNIGAFAHTAIDSHILNNAIHFQQSSINHVNIQNIGINTHANIDTHIADVANPHNTTLSLLPDTAITTPQPDHGLVYIGGQWINQVIDHTTLGNVGTNTHANIDTHIADTDIHAIWTTVSTSGTGSPPTYNALIYDNLIIVDATSNDVIIQLHPTSITRVASLNIKRKDSSVNTITVQGTGSPVETIDGQPFMDVPNQYDNLTIMHDGTEWFIL